MIHKRFGIRSISGLSRFRFIHLSERNRQIPADRGNEIAYRTVMVFHINRLARVLFSN